MDIHHLSDIARRLAHKHAPPHIPTITPEDLHQEGLVAGWRELRRGRPPAHAVTAARSAIIDYLRAHGPQGRTGTLRALPARDEEIAAAYWPVEDDHAEHVATRSMIIRCLSRLTRQEREVLIRHHIHGESLTDIARRWRVTASRVSQLRSQALRRARQECQEDDRGA